MAIQQKLHMSGQHATYLGDFGKADWHRHAAPVLLIGLSGMIRVQTETHDEMCWSALVDANVNHTVDCHGEHVATLYWEIDSCAAAGVRQRYLSSDSVVFDIAEKQVRLMRSEATLLSGEFGGLFGGRAARSLVGQDGRVLECIQRLQSCEPGLLRQTNLADEMGLSPSRLTHLFKQYTGVPLQRYRQWQQLNGFMRDVHRSRDITSSALNAGFYDSAHLSNTYKKIFGISPSKILSGLDEFHII